MQKIRHKTVHNLLDAALKFDIDPDSNAVFEQYCW